MKNIISVVMTTYNGSKYILKQLQSIYRQSRLPDEVIICDDSSDDQTVEMITEFIKDNKLRNWHIYKNDINKGWRYNFFCAASLARGDIIFFSDQDDIWNEEKIKIMAELMNKYKMGALYTEKRVIDAHGRLAKGRMEKETFSGKIREIIFANDFYTQKTLGCCMCVSRQVLDLYLRVHCPECGHDSQCGRLALLYSSLWHLDSPLIDYRIHQKNSSGISEKGSFGQSSLSKRIKDLGNDMQWIKNLMKDDELGEDRKTILKHCYEAMKYRYRYLNSDRGTNFLGLVKYRDYYSGRDMLLGDIAYRHNINKILGTIRWKFGKLQNRVRNKIGGKENGYSSI